jgi:hypothetical protein
MIMHTALPKPVLREQPKFRTALQEETHGGDGGKVKEAQCFWIWKGEGFVRAQVAISDYRLISGEIEIGHAS